MRRDFTISETDNGFAIMWHDVDRETGCGIRRIEVYTSQDEMIAALRAAIAMPSLSEAEACRLRRRFDAPGMTGAGMTGDAGIDCHQELTRALRFRN